MHLFQHYNTKISLKYCPLFYYLCIYYSANEIINYLINELIK